MANGITKIIFPDGNIKRINNEDCSCPNFIDVNLSDLIIGQRYTIFIEQLNDIPVRTFPDSYSFEAKSPNKIFKFYYQFV